MSKSANADEDRSQPHHAGRDRDMGVFWRSRKIKSTLNSTKNYGEGSYREHGFPDWLAPWTFRILTPLMRNSS